MKQNDHAMDAARYALHTVLGHSARATAVYLDADVSRGRRTGE
jgi:hypothetical protein